ncbi:hypothetical protein MSAN_02117800 [Mycena sanguinolenta]|uniref:F-box domain-containing protein n=1 Tax=Mycena sanguinolenta TaxID=230812 RepID=A0A8H6XGT8_9AGAR|nr:hypothetical protein MSAN_02117800 [Mycena sanguinolenta]
MVLTRRAHRLAEIFRCLPNEILVEIIQHSHKMDQATLSRVSKLFHDLCLPVLYRDVKISSDHVIPASIAIRSFCSGIVENPARADAVRSFSLDVPCDTWNIEICCGLILATLKLMLKLDYLSIFGSALDVRQWDMLLEHCNFSQLISCNIWAAPEAIPPLEAFLARHSTLKRIHIHPGYRRMVPSRSASISLPNLEYYHGNASFIPAINATSLKKVQLDWHPEDDVDVDKYIIGISSMKKPHLQFVSHIYTGEDPFHQMLTSISNHIPHTKTLQIRANSIVATTVHRITTCLQQFTGLVYLELGYNGGFRQSAAKAEDEIVVEGYGAACPTLEGCCFHNRAWRKVDGRWEEYPVSEFLVLTDGFFYPGY